MSAPGPRPNSVFEQPDLVEGIPDHGREFGTRGGLSSLPTQTNPILGCCDDPVIPCSHRGVFACCRIAQDRAFTAVSGTTRDSGKSKLILQPWSFVLAAAQTFTVPFCVKTQCVHTKLFMYM